MPGPITEEKIRRNLHVFTVITICILIFIALSAVRIGNNLNAIQSNSVDETTSARADSVIKDIERHMSSDFRLLRTMAAFLEATRLTDSDNHTVSSVRLSESMHKINFYNDFLTVAWYNLQGDGTKLYIESGLSRASALNRENILAQEAAKNAFLGEASTSRFYFDPSSKRRIMTHATPLCIEGEIQGVIMGAHDVTELQSILDTAADINPDFSFFILDENGSFVASASKNRGLEIIRYIQGGEKRSLPVFSPENRELIRDTNSGRLSFEQNGEKFKGVIRPLSFGEMRLLCLNTAIDATSVTSRNIFLTRLTFFSLCAFVILAVVFGYRLLYKYGSRLTRILFFDPLTGADNGNRFRKKLYARLSHPGRNSCCVVSLNIRRFKFINEIFGVESANKLLFIIKETLEENLVFGEFFCRNPPDVFQMYLHEFSPGLVRSRLESLMAEIARKYTKVHDYRLQMYAGVVMLNRKNEPEIRVDEINLRLSLALAKAKTTVNDSICIYDESLHETEERENYIETHMEQALQDGSFKMYLQPKIDLHSGTLGGAEALVRWETNGNRMIYPDQFIPLFNQNGFCIKLDIYMLEKACKLIRQWMDDGIEPIPLSVNQSRLVFFEADYIETVTGITAKYGIPPGLITLEILEELYMEKSDEVNSKINLLRQKGFLISMDDFGSGYSSFSMIGDLCVDELKLDREFLMKAASSESWRMKIIIDQIVRMARRLHLSVVAEGVENEENETLVKTLGCDYGQGYYYCKPIPTEEFNGRYMYRGETRSGETPQEPSV